MGTEPTICIAIITYQRPTQLENTLRSLAAMRLPSLGINLLVVDNDNDQSARSTVENLRPSLPFALRYVVEEARGIPAARNRALQEAAQADYLAFIDDDDTVDKEWLANLHAAMERYGADVVRGQIEYSFPPGKEYLGRIDLFAPLAATTGDELSSACTGNILLRTQVYKNAGLAFDMRFTRTGGSDHHFFRILKEQGARIVFCREAIVHVAVPPARTSWRWLMQRNLRVGATLTMSDIRARGHRYAWRQVVTSISGSLRYFLRLMRGVAKREVHFIHPAMVIMFIIGRVAGLMHLSPREYR